MSATLLRQLSSEGAALIASLLPRSWAIGGSSGRTVSAIHWLGPYLVAPAEALGDAEQVRLYPPPGTGQSYAPSPAGTQGELVAADLSTDVAVVRMSAAVAAERPVLVPQSEPLQPGERVAIVGRDRHGALAGWGSVRVAGPAWRSRRGGQIDQRLEFAADVDERCEGALVATAQGHIAAMLVSGPRGRRLGIPAATIERIIGRVEHYGYLPRPYLGVRLQALQLDESAATRFARASRRIPVIAGIDADSPAAAAGLAPGDLIHRIDDQEVDGVDGLREVLAGIRVGQTLHLLLLRGGMAEPRTLAVSQRPRPPR